MFTTRMENAFDMPLAKGTSGTSHWSLVGLSSELPWFFVNYRVHAWEGKKAVAVARSCFLKTDEALIEIIERAHQVDFVTRATRTAGGGARWRFLEVQEIWLAERPEGGFLVRHVLTDDAVLYNEFDQPVESKANDRCLWRRPAFPSSTKHDA